MDLGEFILFIWWWSNNNKSFVYLWSQRLKYTTPNAKVKKQKFQFAFCAKNCKPEKTGKIVKSAASHN